MNYREGLPPLLKQMRDLPLDPRGYPIPWFVADVDGVRDFRVAAGAKRIQAVNERRCWVCGGKLHAPIYYFVVGPMCAVNRVTSEPASHWECAAYAAQACPFLLLPKAQYRDANLPVDVRPAAGFALDRNPGVTCVYGCKSFAPFQVGAGNGGWLIRLHDPVFMQWWAQGRAATREEIITSLDGGMPTLRALAEQDGGRAPLELDYAYQRLVLEWMPA